MIKVFIDSIRVSLMSQLRVVILKDPLSERYLPIFIGPCEAEAIAMRLQNVHTERPMTHDLLKAMIAELGGEVQHIVVNDLRNDTFYAQIAVEQDGDLRLVDSRPSDAIALAVRLDVPIYVEEAVMERASITAEEDVSAEDEAEETEKKTSAEKTDADTKTDEDRLSIFEDFLESLDLDDLDADEDND